MKERFNLDREKLLNSILFILENLGGSSDMHKIFKILYFADQKHLATYGFPITGDYYIAMPYGPVPSMSYDMLKALRGDSFFKPEYKDFFDVRQNQVSAKQSADLEELAESDVECLIESIEENRNLPFDVLSEKSHKFAWTKNYNPSDANENEISMLDIAEEMEIDKGMKAYILLNIENQQFLENYAKLR